MIIPNVTKETLHAKAERIAQELAEQAALRVVYNVSDYATEVASALRAEKLADATEIIFDHLLLVYGYGWLRKPVVPVTEEPEEPT